VKKVAAGVAVVALGLSLGACGGDDSPPKPVYPSIINITGDITLTGPTYVRGNLSDCAGAGVYADLAKGAPVTVSNEAGVPIAVGKVQYSVGTNVYQNQLDQCTLRYAAYAVPRAASYQVVVGQQAPVPARFYDLVVSRGRLDFKLPAPPSTTTTAPIVTKPPR
jgi:hypothetical protein